MKTFITRLILTTATILTGACGGSSSQEAMNEALDPTPTATGDAVRIVILGDSISAGLGLAEAEAFPAVTQEVMRAAGHTVEIVNAGVSGDTSAGGLRRIDWILRQQPHVVVVELGANDALRGQPLDVIEGNLREIIQRSRLSGARVVLLGMDVPTNYGPEYAGGFAEMYERIAAEEKVTLVPGFMRNVGVDPQLMQADGLHPNAEGQIRLAETLVPFFEEMVLDISEERGDYGARE